MIIKKNQNPQLHITWLTRNTKQCTLLFKPKSALFFSGIASFLSRGEANMPT